MQIYPHKLSGFTLIEMMVAIAIVAILIALAVPSFGTMIERSRLKALAETVYANLQFAKSEALKGQQSNAGNVRVTFKRDGTPQCLGMIRGASDCDCLESVTTETDFCQIDGAEKRVLITDADFPGAEISGAGDTSITFDSIRGTATNATITLSSSTTSTMQLNVVVSTLGRIRMCVPTGQDAITGYDGC